MEARSSEIWNPIKLYEIQSHFQLILLFKFLECDMIDHFNGQYLIQMAKMWTIYFLYNYYKLISQHQEYTLL